MTTTFLWTREDEAEVTIEVEFTCTAVVPATYFDPPEGGEIEIERFTADCPFEWLEEFRVLYHKGGDFARDVDEACYAAAPTMAESWEQGRAEWLAD